MKNIHVFLIKLANVAVPISIVFGTISGFFSFGYANPFSGFQFLMAVFGAFIGLISSALASSVLVILLELLATVQRIELMKQ